MAISNWNIEWLPLNLVNLFDLWLLVMPNAVFCGAFLCIFALLSPTLKSSEVKVAYFSQDPPSIDPLSPTFDPDSYAVIAQLFDSLVHMDLDGYFKPGLATEWQKLSDTRWLFKLRQGVKFHNGEVFDAEAVKFTFDYILNPDNKAGNRWIFNSIKSVELVNDSPHQIIFETHFPDGMFLNRFNLFGSICPPKYVTRYGFANFQKFPIGTGPFQFVNWQKFEKISLVKNPNYWQKNLPYIDRVNFIITAQKNWVDNFINNQIDVIPNLSGNRTSDLMRKSQGNAKIIKRPVLMSYWVLLKNQGPLANLKVRQALNYAIDKKQLIRFADFGNALPLASLGKVGEFGANPNITPYHFDMDKSRQLLLESGVKLPIQLKALVADIAETTAKIIKAHLREVGITLELEVVSRSEWTNRVVVHKIVTGKRPEHDIVINLVDNPVYSLAFHAGLFLESSSPWSLLDSSEFDKRFVEALKVTDQDLHEIRLQQLDKYIHDNALMIFTTQKVITAAVKKRLSINKFGGNGHLGYDILSNVQVLDNQ